MSDRIQTEIETLLEVNGFRPVRDNNHLVFRNHEGKTFVTGATPSDYRSMLNSLSALRRIIAAPAPSALKSKTKSNTTLTAMPKRPKGIGGTRRSKGNGFTYFPAPPSGIPSPPKQAPVGKPLHQRIAREIGRTAGAMLRDKIQERRDYIQSLVDQMFRHPTSLRHEYALILATKQHVWIPPSMFRNLSDKHMTKTDVITIAARFAISQWDKTLDDRMFVTEVVDWYEGLVWRGISLESVVSNLVSTDETEITVEIPYHEVIRQVRLKLAAKRQKGVAV